MKHSISTIALATLAAIASLTAAHAQTLASRVNVPFAFDCGSAHFAAGSYTISMQGSDVVAVSNDAQRSTRLAVIESKTNSGSPNAPATVTFKRYGDSYFLAEYSTSGETITLLKSKTERSLAHEYALNPTEPSVVQLAAK